MIIAYDVTIDHLPFLERSAYMRARTAPMHGGKWSNIFYAPTFWKKWDGAVGMLLRKCSSFFSSFLAPQRELA
eukprot:5838430-Amphidinium_carterae.1